MSEPQLDFNFIDETLLMIQPPTDIFPPTNQYFLNQLNGHLIRQAQKFLSVQKQLYMCSKKVEQRLKIIVQSSKNLLHDVYKKDQNWKRIYEQLTKYRQNKQKLQNRQKTLSMICQLIKLQNLKETLLIQKRKSPLFNGPHIQSQKELQKGRGPINQESYLQNISKIYQIVKESDQIFSEQDREKYSLINQIINQLTNLFQTATKRALNQFLSPTMINLILNKYTHPFLDKKLRIYNIFQAAFVNNRLQHYRLALNPILNNINYANNVSDLYESVIDNWLKIINEQMQLFKGSGQEQIIKRALKLFIQQIMPKLQKNAYKFKKLSQICFARFKINSLYEKLISVRQWNDQRSVQTFKLQKQIKPPAQLKIEQDQALIVSKQKWEPFPTIIQTLKLYLTSKLQEQSAALSSQKFNIYSIASYVPVRQHLETIKLCKSYGIKRQNQIINWQAPFQKLFLTRQPLQQPNNKSLVIFNLNIWYLYLKIIKNGTYETKAVQVMLWCKQRFVQMNIQQAVKAYYQSLQKILDMCGNISAFKNVLYAQLNLLGHQNLRNEIALSIKQKYLNIYQETLKKLQKKPMDNEQIKDFCKQHKINLNKFGKYSNQICIYPVQELAKLLNYN